MKSKDVPFENTKNVNKLSYKYFGILKVLKMALPKILMLMLLILILVTDVGKFDADSNFNEHSEASLAS